MSLKYYQALQGLSGCKGHQLDWKYWISWDNFPVIKLVTLHCLLFVAMANGWENHQMNVHMMCFFMDTWTKKYTWYYILVSPSNTKNVYRLKKTPYGLDRPLGIDY